MRWCLAGAAVLAALLAAASAVAQSATLQFHPVDKPVIVQDFTEFTVWIVGTRAGSTADPGQIVRLNASVPALIKAITAQPPAERVLTMLGSSPNAYAIDVHGLRVRYATSAIRAGQAETPRLATPETIPAGKAIRVQYNLTTGQILLDLLN